jgi:hypothetical protein
VADVTDGYGPEALVVDGPRAYPYRVHAQLAALDSGGQTIGEVEVLDHDGAGRIAFQEHPFVLQKVGGSALLATLNAPLTR